MSSGTWVEFHRTEIISSNIDPKIFKGRPVIQYSFGEKQLIMFKIYDANLRFKEDDYIGSAKCKLGDVIIYGQVSKE